MPIKTEYLQRFGCTGVFCKDLLGYVPLPPIFNESFFWQGFITFYGAAISLFTT
jgi:hypothetical protein